MYCKHCGERNEVNARFCRKCGGNTGVSVSQPNGVSSPPKKTASMNHKRIGMIACGVVIAIIVIGIIIAFNSNRLSGTYESTCGRFTVNFINSREFTWQQSGTLLRGSYQAQGDSFILTVHGQGWYLSTNYTARVDGNDLIISGGNLRNVRFTRQ